MIEEIPEKLTIKDHILPFCKTKPRGEVVDVDNGMKSVTQQLLQQLLPNKLISSKWHNAINIITGDQICFIETVYAEVLLNNHLMGKTTFGEVTDALEMYLKENNND